MRRVLRRKRLSEQIKSQTIGGIRPYAHGAHFVRAQRQAHRAKKSHNSLLCSTNKPNHKPRSGLFAFSVKDARVENCFPYFKRIRKEPALLKFYRGGLHLEQGL